MSIIEDALKRLQEERSEGSVPRPPQPSFDPGFVVGGKRPRNGRLTIYAAFAAAAIALGGGAWLGLDLYQDVLRSHAGAEPLDMAATPATEEYETAADSAAPVKSVESGSAPDVTAAKIAEAGDLREAAAPAPGDEDGTAPAMMKNDEPTTAQDDAVRLVKIAQSTHPMRPGMEEGTAGLKPSAGGGDKPEPESWIAKGWKTMKSGGLGAALPVWEKGLRNLDPRRIVYIAKVYESKKAAVSALDLAGEASFAFLVRGGHGGSEAYYLLAAPPMGLMLEKRKEIQKALSLTGMAESQAGLLLDRMREELFAPQPMLTQPKSAPPWQVRETPPAVAESAPASPDASIEPTDGSYITPSAEPAARKPKTTKPPFALADRFTQARHLVREGSYAEALKILQPEFKETPSGWEPYFLIGTVYLGMGRLDLAEKYLDRGLAVDPGRARLWLQRAVVAQQKNDNARALRLLDEALKLDPSIPEIHLNIGYSSEAAGNKESAAKAYRAFLSLSRDETRYREIRETVVKRLVELGY